MLMIPKAIAIAASEETAKVKNTRMIGGCGRRHKAASSIVDARDETLIHPSPWGRGVLTHD